jgi:anti-sigma regulatory factor (Ser/Thr protein kinase)
VVAGSVRETMTVAGLAERARAARRFVEAVPGPGHPCGDVAALLVSELFGNSVRHSGSGAPGARHVRIGAQTSHQDHDLRLEY